MNYSITLTQYAPEQNCFKIRGNKIKDINIPYMAQTKNSCINALKAIRNKSIISVFKPRIEKMYFCKYNYLLNGEISLKNQEFIGNKKSAMKFLKKRKKTFKKDIIIGFENSKKYGADRPIRGGYTEIDILTFKTLKNY